MADRRFPVVKATVASLVVGAFFAFWSLFSITLAPPSATPRKVVVATAATHVLLDAPESLITKPTAVIYDFDAYSKRAALLGNLTASPPVRDKIAGRVGLRPEELAMRSRLTMPVQYAMRDPDFETRAAQLVDAHKAHRIELQADPDNPILNIYAQAPTVEMAERLADTAVVALNEYLTERAVRAGVRHKVVLDQMGAARGAVSNGPVEPMIVALTFLAGAGLCFALLFGASRVRRGWMAAADGPASDRTAGLTARTRTRIREATGPGGDWPHTTRVMPWFVAAFLVVLWLVPFNAIQLSVSLPFDAKLDRLVLPLLFAMWVLALAVGGSSAPRLRLTLIHVGLAGLVSTALLSIVLNADTLNHALEFDLSFKKLTLLLSYVTMFVIIASTVRRTEVPAFLKFTLVLAVIAAAGTVWEYRFKYNVFYSLSDSLLPGVFTIGKTNVGAHDDLGRMMTLGPSDHPLEVTAMLTMALPIALVGIMHSSERRTRVLYVLAACFIIAAAISTFRKSALLGPVFVVATIAYFRRRELLKLAPLGFVSLIAIHALSPGAMGSILVQLSPDRLGVSTVSDRAADYDAVRPDMWANLAFGRGYGSYDHWSYRILDSEMLSRVVDVGLIGTLSLVFAIGCILGTAKTLINQRHARWSPIGLTVASAAVAFFVLAFLFDVTSFPHVPYILLSLAGFLAAVLSAEPSSPRVTPRVRRLRTNTTW